MLEFLKVLAVVASIATHSPCAVADNVGNVVVRAGVDGGRVSVWRYVEHLDDPIIWRHSGTRARPPLVVRMAFVTLFVGHPGPHIRLACNVTSGIL